MCNITNEVLTEHVTSINEHVISLDYLVAKMLEKKIITDAQRRKITDRMTGLSTDERIDNLLDILIATVKADKSVFHWFMEIFREYDTILSVRVADQMEARYYELVKEKESKYYCLSYQYIYCT